jgi:pimeloyl-ACP methyl ester carboxylesterase
MKPFSNFTKGVALSALASFAGTFMSVLVQTAPAHAATLGGPLTLEDEGAFFVGGKIVTSNYPGASLVTGPSAPGKITVNQMYVHYRIPAGKQGVPVVMVHGSNHTGMTYETTPDGREGWATYFVRKGAPVYVVDHSGRGRSGFDPTPFNQVRDQTGSNPASLPTLLLATHERAWLNFRLGASNAVPFPGLQFPTEAMEQYTMQLVPNAETSLAGVGANTVNALAALLDRIGPSVVIVHSQSGVYGLDLVRKRTNLVKALVTVEGGCDGFTDKDAAAHFAKVPVLSLWGDNSVGAKQTVNGDARRNGCLAAVNAIKAAGGRATLTLLPEIGIKGNSHMMMMDRNNLQVAEVISKWLAENQAR